MKKLVIIAFVLALVGCRHTPTFTVNGEITHAMGETLYLEHTALMNTIVVDSCILDNSGTFSFSAPAPAYPDFYRLRIGARSLLLAVDSTETITITTTHDSLPYTQSIQGSENSQSIAQLRAVARSASKEELRSEAKKLIISNPRSLAAYYAVFLKQNGAYVWDITDPADRRMYQAVATSFQVWMPEYERTKALYEQVMTALQTERKAYQQAAMQQLIEQSENAFLDITLPDADGVEKSLSQLRGKLVVLDFSAINMEQSKGYIFELRELYNRYHKKGLEIYSISLDRNKFLWEDAVANLPWTTVYAGEKATDVLMLYNVQNLPTLFLLDKQGNVQGRYSDFNQLDADIRKYL